MNKLDAISRRSKGTRALVRLIKIAITGCSACILIASSTHLRFGGVTYALDGSSAAAPNQFSVTVPEVQNMQLPTHLALDEDAVLALFPVEDTPSTDENEPPQTEEPPVTEPDPPVSISNDVVTFDENGRLLLRGEPLASLTAQTGAQTPAISDPVDDSYFSEGTLFIGNSLVVGLQKAAPFNSRYYASIGMSVSQFFEKQLIAAPDGEKNPDGSPKIVTAAEAVARDEDFRRVYLMFGINELGWASIDAFINRYETMIDLILNVKPDAVIYVQGLLPINEAVYTATAATPYECFTNERIAQFNARIYEMAQRKQVVYLAPGEVLADENGVLPAEATTDGIHLNAQYIRRWADYLRTHTAE